MLEDIKVLTTRTAYEFRPDDLRLSMLSTKPIQDGIQQLFHFQATSIGTPAPTFGDVPLTFPPGLVFNTGVWLSPDGQLVPIRLLHFEQHRIVIDVAGLSAATVAIFGMLQQFLSSIQAPDGSPIIGEPEQVLDYSEISARFPGPLDTILPKSMHELFSSRSKEKILVPTLVVQSYPLGQVVAGTPVLNDARAFTLALRAGTRPEDRIYFSAAPLDSEAHLAYLTELERVLTPTLSMPQRVKKNVATKKNHR